MTTSTTPHIRMQKSAAGMGRFFSPRNLARYRRLASGAIGEPEQQQLLEDLAKEMNAFRREARVAAVNQRPAFVGSQAPGRT
jgi:hypothetical protein